MFYKLIEKKVKICLREKKSSTRCLIVYMHVHMNI